MVLVWRSYRTDLGRVYPLYPFAVGQANDTVSDIDPLTFLPSTVTADLVEQNNSCPVAGLAARILSIWDKNGANWRINYPVPFNENLANALTTNLDIQAWEFIGERVTWGRLKRMLGNV